VQSYKELKRVQVTLNKCYYKTPSSFYSKLLLSTNKVFSSSMCTVQLHCFKKYSILNPFHNLMPFFPLQFGLLRFLGTQRRPFPC
jgi:hypothetical protein